MFSWSRLGDLNPGPMHYERKTTKAICWEIIAYQRFLSRHGPR